MVNRIIASIGVLSISFYFVTAGVKKLMPMLKDYWFKKARKLSHKVNALEGEIANCSKCKSCTRREEDDEYGRV